jgi:hypothetical protein
MYIHSWYVCTCYGRISLYVLKKRASVCENLLQFMSICTHQWRLKPTSFGLRLNIWGVTKHGRKSQYYIFDTYYITCEWSKRYFLSRRPPTYVFVNIHFNIHTYVPRYIFYIIFAATVCELIWGQVFITFVNSLHWISFKLLTKFFMYISLELLLYVLYIKYLKHYIIPCLTFESFGWVVFA